MGKMVRSRGKSHELFFSESPLNKQIKFFSFRGIFYMEESVCCFSMVQSGTVDHLFNSRAGASEIVRIDLSSTFHWFNDKTTIQMRSLRHN